MVERRAGLLKKRLLRDEDLFAKYNATMNEYIEEGHAERVPTDELQPGDMVEMVVTISLTESIKRTRHLCKAEFLYFLYFYYLNFLDHVYID